MCATSCRASRRRGSTAAAAARRCAESVATAALLSWAVAEKERATLGEGGDGGEYHISGLAEVLLRVLVARGDTPRVCLPLLRTSWGCTLLDRTLVR